MWGDSAPYPLQDGPRAQLLACAVINKTAATMSLPGQVSNATFLIKVTCSYTRAKCVDAGHLPGFAEQQHQQALPRHTCHVTFTNQDPLNGTPSAKFPKTMHDPPMTPLINHFIQFDDTRDPLPHQPVLIDLMTHVPPITRQFNWFDDP